MQNAQQKKSNAGPMRKSDTGCEKKIKIGNKYNLQIPEFPPLRCRMDPEQKSPCYSHHLKIKLLRIEPTS